MKDNNKYSSSRLHDWIIDCDICGSPTWHSETKKLDTYTGFGGALVCKHCIYPIDYGLVPFKIPAENGVPETRILTNFNNNSGITGDAPLVDFEFFNPLNTTPEMLNDFNIWDKSIAVWDAVSTTIQWDKS